MAKEKIAVIGMGTMGSQIGIVFAKAGFATAMHDVDQGRVDQGLARIREFLDKQAAKGKMTKEESGKTLANIHAGSDLKTAVAEADLVIEAVFEDAAVKRAVFAELDRLARPEAGLATNTST